MKNFDFDKTWLGTILGLLAPFLVFVCYYLINYRYMDIRSFINFLKLGEAYTSIISLCVLANLGVFYLFIWKEKYKGARGVLGSTFIWAAFVLYLKFTSES